MTSELMPIKEVAAMLGVVPQTIRQWECKYALIKAVRSQAGHRLYNAEQINTMHTIQKMIRSGLSIEQIQSQFGAETQAFNDPSDFSE